MGSSFRTAVEHLADSDGRDVRARRPAVRDDARVPARCSTRYRQHAPPIVSVRYGEVMAPPHLFAARVLSRARRAPARRAFRSLQRHASGPRSCSFRRICWWTSTRPRTTSAPRAACRRDGEGCRREPAEKPAVESAPNREQLAQDRQRHFFRRLGAEREPHGAAHAAAVAGIRHVALRPPGPPAACRSATGARARRCRPHRDSRLNRRLS